MMTAKARMASMRWPATGSPAGVGSNSTATSAATAANNPQFDANQLVSLGVGFGTSRTTGWAMLDMASSAAKPPWLNDARGAKNRVEKDQLECDKRHGAKSKYSTTRRRAHRAAYVAIRTQLERFSANAPRPSPSMTPRAPRSSFRCSARPRPYGPSPP